MNKITPCLWFDNQAEEAAHFYTSIFKNSKIGSVSRYSDNEPGRSGSVMTITFELDGHEFMALNGGPSFTFSEAVSFVINCDSQSELDYYWDRLSAGGELQQCGWLKDKFGLSWQIVPKMLDELMESADPEQAERVKQVVLKSIKLDVNELKRAYDGAEV